MHCLLGAFKSDYSFRALFPRGGGVEDPAGTPGAGTPGARTCGKSPCTKCNEKFAPKEF